jgi:Fe-S-cluster-containing dehydrogenase component
MNKTTRRDTLTKLAGVAAAAVTLNFAKGLKAAVQAAAEPPAPPKYDPTQHKWVMAINADRCIGCGLCAEACKKENHVPEGPYFRTWIERYTIEKPQPGSGLSRGEVHIDSPKGGMHGYPPLKVPAENVQHSFFVPKLCNLCHHSPCVQVCPVGATFDAPDGAVLID